MRFGTGYLLAVSVAQQTAEGGVLGEDQRGVAVRGHRLQRKGDAAAADASEAAGAAVAVQHAGIVATRPHTCRSGGHLSAVTRNWR